MFKKLLTHHIDQQYRRPSGIVGRYIGQRMASDHWPENQWTIHPVVDGCKPDDWEGPPDIK